MIKWNKLALLLIILIAIVGLSFPARSYVEENVNLGLDLAGGIYVLLEAEDLDEHPDPSQAIDGAITVLRSRVDELGVSEPVIQQEGSDRIRVELAGEDIDREEAMEVIERTAQLEFYGPELIEDPDFDMGILEKLPEEEEQPTVPGDVLDNYEPLLTGEHLEDASAGYDQYNRPMVGLEFTSEGRERFADATSRYIGEPIIMVLDDEIVSAPSVDEPITGGEASIRNIGSIEEASNIAVMLRAGALPVTLTELETRSVGPTLGADLLEDSVLAGIIGLTIVVLFMIVVYRVPGVMSAFALGLYLMIVFLILINLGATFTLPGIAGLILSIGMAVDANVIIFERIKEELRNKKTLRSSVDYGFKKALSTILDSNVTTLIGATILFFFGTGPVRGFAVTLSVGIVASMFTALVFSKLILRTLIQTRLIKNPKYFGVKGDF